MGVFFSQTVASQVRASEGVCKHGEKGARVRYRPATGCDADAPIFCCSRVAVMGLADCVLCVLCI